MAQKKLSHLQETKKSDQQQPKAEVPGDYYLDREQLDSMRHLILAAQGISKEFTGQDEVKAIGELFPGFSNGLSSIMETIEGQRIEKGGAQ
jgi:hypothetical protein